MWRCLVQTLNRCKYFIANIFPSNNIDAIPHRDTDVAVSLHGKWWHLLPPLRSHVKQQAFVRRAPVVAAGQHYASVGVTHAV